MTFPTVEDKLTIRKQYLKNNPCYTHDKRIVPRGILIHSPAVARPDAGWLMRAWNKPTAKACTHAIVTEDEVIQILPWHHRCWGCGSGPNGSANATHVQFDVMEPYGHTYKRNQIMDYKHDEIYFQKVWNNAILLTKQLMLEFGISREHVIDHSEAAKLGLASKHADWSHWIKLHGNTMDDFRNELSD